MAVEEHLEGADVAETIEGEETDVVETLGRDQRNDRGALAHRRHTDRIQGAHGSSASITVPSGHCRTGRRVGVRPLTVGVRIPWRGGRPHPDGEPGTLAAWNLPASTESNS